jgi:hypothetical protein
LKKAAYVGLVVAAYRMAMDDPSRAGEAGELLDRAYHRPFTRGYVDGPHPSLARLDERGNVGVEAGAVTRYDPARGTVRVRLTAPLKAGDGIDLRGKGRSVGQAMPPMRRDGARVVAAEAGDEVEFPVKTACFSGDRLRHPLRRAPGGLPQSFPREPPGGRREVRVVGGMQAARGPPYAWGATPGGVRRDLAVPSGPRAAPAPIRRRIAETLATTASRVSDDRGESTCRLFIPLAPLKKAVRAFKRIAARLDAAWPRDRKRRRARRARRRVGVRGRQPTGVRGGNPLHATPLFLLDATSRSAAGLRRSSHAQAHSVQPPAPARCCARAQAPMAAGYPMLNALELLDLGFTGFVFTPEARPGDLLVLPAWALASGDVCAFGRAPLAEIRHDLDGHLPPGPGPHRLVAREGDLLAAREGASTTLHADEFFSLLKSLPDLYAAGARRFRFMFPLLDDGERGMIARFSEAAPALKAALAAGDRTAWGTRIASLLAGCASRASSTLDGRLE